MATKTSKPKTNPLHRLFLPYQRKWIRDKSLRKLGEKSRQVGMSWTEAFVSTTEAANGDWDVYITTRDEDLAKQFIEDCRTWASLIEAVAQLDDNPIDDDVIAKLTFSSGKSISIVSSSPTAVIGKRGKIIIDEAGDHKNLKKLFEAAEPCTTWGFPLVIFSAHYHGKKTFFNELVRKHKDYGFSFHHIDFETAVEQGLLDRILEKAGRVEVGRFKMAYEGRKTTKEERKAYCEAKKKSVGTVIYMQAYMCVPSDEESQFITLALYDPCERNNILLPMNMLHTLEGDLYGGLDFARYAHLSVIWITQHIGTQYITRFIFAMEKKDTPYQMNRLREFMQLRNMRRLCIDRTGPGIGIHDYAAKEFSSRIEGVNFSAAIKETLGYRVKQYLEEGSFLVPDIAVVRADFTSIQKIITGSENIRLDATENEENPASHADHFWAGALSLEAASGIPLGKPQVTLPKPETVPEMTKRSMRLEKYLKGYRRCS